jgi:hypothetical protein
MAHHHDPTTGYLSGEGDNARKGRPDQLAWRGGQISSTVAGSVQLVGDEAAHDRGGLHRPLGGRRTGQALVNAWTGAGDE